MDALFILLIALAFFLRGLRFEQEEEVEDFDEASLEVRLNPSFYRDEDAFSRYAYELGFSSISTSDSGTGLRMQDVTSNTPRACREDTVPPKDEGCDSPVQDVPNLRVDFDGNFFDSFAVHEKPSMDRDWGPGAGEFTGSNFDWFRK